MSESIYPDPVAPNRGGVRVSAPPAPEDGPAALDVTGTSPGLLPKIIGRWWLVAICIALGIVAGFVYFALTPKTYTARCVIAAEIERGTVAGDVVPDDFLFQQRDLIQSVPVRAAAATAMIQSDDRVRDATNVSVSKGEGVITIAYSAAAADEAARGANAVAEAYLRTRARQQTSATSGLSDLTRQRDQLSADRATRESSLREFRQKAGAAGSEAERAAAARLEQLQQAVTAAERENATATAALDAGKQAVADPQKLAAVIEANRGKGVFDRLEAQRGPIETEIAQLTAQLEKQRKTMLPEHPVVIATQRKLEQAKTRLADLDKQYATVYTAHLEQQQTTAQKRVDEVKQLLAAQSGQAKDLVARGEKIAEIEAAMKKIDVAIAEIDKKIRDVTLSTGAAAAAPTVKIIAPAQAPSRAAHPDRDRTIAGGAIIGLVAGLCFAAIIPRRRQGP